MEHQTMSFMSNFNYDLIAHELAHQWFGDKVTCGSWKELWLNEGFATY
jgi:aminopeptidase N